MATVTVRGEAVVPGRPDEAVVSLELAAVRATAEEAYEDVAGRSGALDQACSAVGIDPSARSTAGVTVQEHREYDERGRPEHRGYVASNRVVIRLEDAALVGGLLREAVVRAQARVLGPVWRVASDNPARAEACRRAAGEARRKAEAYADGLGLGVGAVLEAREPWAGGDPRRERGMTFSALDAEIPVDPGELDVRAAVEVTFALEQR